MGKREYVLVYSVSLVIGLLVLAVPVPAADITIVPNDPVQGSIRGAIINASSGDRIILGAGTYNEYDILIDKDITVRSQSGNPADTIIDATNSGRIFTSNGGNSLTIDNLTLRNGHAEAGGGIYNDGGTVTITGSTITGCSADGDFAGGGGLYNNAGTITIIASTFSGCSASWWGGALLNFGTVTITGSTFTGCSAGGTGGAICSFNGGSTVTINNSTITGCSAPVGGGIRNDYGTVTITGSTITGCSATDDGGAIENSVGSLIITGSTITGCSATNDGGAIYAYGGATIGITDTTFTSCTATGNGGAISLDDASTSITGTTFTGCTAVYGGAINANNPPGFSVASSRFTGCQATTGGGAIAVSGTGTPSIFSSDFGSCSAGSDGGGAVLSFPASTIHFSRFHGNTATGSGTAVRFVSTSSDATDNWWSSNSGPGSAYYGDPAAVASWLMLGITASPAVIDTTGTSAIQTNLTFNSDGTDTAPGGIFIPDAVPNMYAVVTGSGSVAPATDGTVNGFAGTTFSPVYGENVNISGTVDDQTVYIGLPVAQEAPGITAITPDSGINYTSTFITNLAGSGFTPYGTTVLLMRSGHANITATGITVVSPGQITCMLPITFAEAGACDVVVVNPDQREAVLPGGFTILAAPTPTPPPVTLDTRESDDDRPYVNTPVPTSVPGSGQLMTVTVNIGGQSKAWQAIVTGTKLSGLIVTGTVQPGPGSNQTAPPGTVFQYFTLVPARYDTITNAVINFTVPQSWLENHIDPKNVVLYRQTAGGWEALPTTFLYGKDGTVYFSAQSGGFSLFAIAGTPAVATPVATVKTPAPFSSPALLQVPAAVAKAPVTTQTPAPPAPAPAPAGSSGLPLVTISSVALCCAGLIGGGWCVRRWWIRRQNPALFREYD